MAELKWHEELVVIAKTYDLILRSCKHTGKFPRNHRFVLGERIERNLYDLLETLIRAKYTKQRQVVPTRPRTEFGIKQKAGPPLIGKSLLGFSPFAQD